MGAIAHEQQIPVERGRQAYCQLMNEHSFLAGSLCYLHKFEVLTDLGAVEPAHWFMWWQEDYPEHLKDW